MSTCCRLGEKHPANQLSPGSLKSPQSEATGSHGQAALLLCPLGTGHASRASCLPVLDPQLPELPLSLTVASGWGSPASPLAPLCFFLGLTASEGDGMGSSMDGRGCGLTSLQLDGGRLHHGVPAPSCGRQRPTASHLWKSPFLETCVPQKRSPRWPWCSH